MPAYNFKPQFAPLVKDKRKRQTIRPRRRVRRTYVGDKLALYTGMRTKNCTLLLNVTCDSVETIYFDTEHDPDTGKLCDYAVYIGDGERLTPEEEDQLALADGFESFGAMIDFFKSQYGLPWEGELIKW